MANVKFSGLPAATTPLTGAEIVAATQGGVSKQAALNLLQGYGAGTAVGDAAYTILATDRVVYTNVVFTTSRTWTLPAASAYPSGVPLVIVDSKAAVTATNTLVVSRGGSDTINGAVSSLTLSVPSSNVEMVSDGVSNWTVINRSAVVAKITWVTSGTTYTPTVGVRAMLVECIAGGGGGGGATAAASNIAVGGGGGGGGYSAKFITGAGIKASYTIAVGTGGTAGVAANGTGGTGVTTSFDSPSVCTATGGVGGAGGTSGTALGANTYGGVGGGGTVGDLGVSGSDGGSGTILSATAFIAGAGGGSMRAGSRRPVAGTSASAGATGNLYGGGGSGAASTSATGFAGGAGSAGVIQVTEYF